MMMRKKNPTGGNGLLRLWVLVVVFAMLFSLLIGAVGSFSLTLAG